MEKDNSILNKIIQSRQMHDVNQFQPADIVSHILSSLSMKEREVITKRFSLDGEDKLTLEEIGRQHNITRERIRQIQTSAIKKIKEMKTAQEHLETVLSAVKKVLSDYGGIMEESHFLDELLAYADNNPRSRNAALFIVSELLDDEIEEVKDSELLLSGWKLRDVTLDIAHEIVDILYQLIEQEKKLLKLEDIIEKFRGHQYFANNEKRIRTNISTSLDSDNLDEERLQRLLYSLLKISNKIDDNILDEWGLAHWPEVTPKRMGDKVYLILKGEKKPMHFVEITDAINKAKFDKKVAYPATIHNELILDDRFVLVGRGIYALKEWGYRDGTVTDVIVDILKASPKPLTKDEIVEEVLKKRIVKKSTIFLALTNKNVFKKANGVYTIREDAS